MSGRSLLSNQMSVGNSAVRNSIPIAQSLPSSGIMTSSNNKHQRAAKPRTHVAFSARVRSFSESDDTMFDLDGFQENKTCEPFYESDEDSGKL